MQRMIWILALLCVPQALRAQTVTQHDDANATLAQKWSWAAEQARRPAYGNGYWVGYSIERLMGERSFIGSWSSRTGRTTLHELIYGTRAEFDPYLFRDRSHDDAPERKVLKEVALLFEYRAGATQPSDVRVTNLSGHVDLEGRPLLWLGEATTEESLDWIARQQEQARDDDLREELVTAVGIHQHARVVPMLSGILNGRDDDEVREKAAFWLSQQDDDRVLDLLLAAARTDRSGEVREQAVFGISQVDGEQATEALIDLARKGQGEVREKAIFWLGQKASERAIEALGDVVEDDSEDTDVQRQAVFALSQLPDDQAVPLLIKIARTHAKPAVRKQAIFWLGQSDDPRALDALIALARG